MLSLHDARRHIIAFKLARAFGAIGLIEQLCEASIAILRDVNRTHFPIVQIIVALTSATIFVVANFLAVELQKRFPTAQTKDPVDATERKRLAKRANEQLKLSASFANSLAVSILLGYFLSPLLHGEAANSAGALAQGLTIAACLHAAGHGLLLGWRSED